MARRSGSSGSRPQAPNRIHSRNERRNDYKNSCAAGPSHPKQKPVKKEEAAREADCKALGDSHISRKALMKFLTGPWSMLLVRAAIEHGEQKSKELCPVWPSPAMLQHHAAAAQTRRPTAVSSSSTTTSSSTTSSSSTAKQAAQTAPVPSDAGAGLPGCSGSEEQFFDCHEIFLEPQEECSVAAAAGKRSECCEEVCSEVQAVEQLEDGEVDAVVYLILASCMADCGCV